MTNAPVTLAQPTLRQAAIRGSIWTLGGFGAQQALRLGSNVLLSHLLFPSAFGLMNILNTTMQGLALFSDVGIGPSIIHHKRGEDPAFLNTAWTIQVVRGVLLWLAAVALAWPLSLYYGEQRLVVMLPVVGLTALIAGLNSTALFTLNRRLAMERLTALDLGTQVVGVAVMIAWALISPTVWALVAGGIAGVAFRMGATHALLPGVRNRPAWDSAAAQDLFRFGRWVFISTAIGFLADRGYQLVMGAYMSLEMFGLFSIAMMFPMTVSQAIGRLSQTILFPVYARIDHANEPQLRRAVLRVQVVLMAATLPPLCLLVIFGPWIVGLLYDNRYSEAGWMLQVLAAGQIVASIVAARLPVLLARGDSRRHMIVLATHSLCLLAALGYGGWRWGVPGMLAGISAAHVLNYPVTAWATRRYGVWIPWLDAAAMAACGAAVGIGLWLVSSWR